MALIFNTLALLTTGLVAYLHILATDNLWYWEYPYIDVPIHFLAGATIALWCGAVAVRLSLSLRQTAIFIACLTLAVAVSWEVFEYAIGLVPMTPQFLPDTVLDLLSDFAGAFAAFSLYWYLRRV